MLEDGPGSGFVLLAVLCWLVLARVLATVWQQDHAAVILPRFLVRNSRLAICKLLSYNRSQAASSRARGLLGSLMPA